MSQAKPSTPDRVVVFGTCLIDVMFPHAGLAAMRMLRAAGLEVRYPLAQTCCGQPAYNSGFRDDARRVARLQLDALAGDEPVVVPSASCAGMLREHYPRLFNGTADAARARQLAGRVFEFCDFAHGVLDLELTDRGPPVTVVLHQSCSARREMDVAPAALGLLGRLSNVTVVEPDHAWECCGFGGTFSVKEPEISAAMSADKAAAVAAACAAHDADLLVSQDAGCLMNLDGTARKAGLGFRVQHIAEFVHERTTGPSAA